MKNNDDLFEVIDVGQVESTNINNVVDSYKSALRNLDNIDLNRLLERVGHEVADEVSCYGINDYPNLEKHGDIKILEDSFNLMCNALRLASKDVERFCGSCPLDIYDFENDCENCDSNSEECWMNYFIEKAMKL